MLKELSCLMRYILLRIVSICDTLLLSFLIIDTAFLAQGLFLGFMEGFQVDRDLISFGDIFTSDRAFVLAISTHGRVVELINATPVSSMSLATELLPR